MKKQSLLYGITIILAILVVATLVLVVMPNAGAIDIKAKYIDGAIESETEKVSDELTELKSIQDKAHEMAELARELGLEESSASITEAKSLWSQSQEGIIKITPTEDTIVSFDEHYDIHRKTGLSEEGFNKILSNTNMAGNGKAFLDAEATYNVNGVFMIGIANTESTIGRYCYNNNPYGMLTTGHRLIYYNDFYDATMALGKLINRYYRGRTSVYSFNEKYCPNDSSWASSVLSTMSWAYSKLE